MLDAAITLLEVVLLWLLAEGVLSVLHKCGIELEADLFGKPRV